jgi:uncharacterized protein YgbK (DUF1537 family)
MIRLLAIADDLSGAAEIAGIGHRFGLPTRVLRDDPPARWDVDGLTVIDTDSRSLASGLAAGAVGRALNGCDRGAFDLVYKKVDSVLRGQIRAELAAVMEVLHDQARVVLLAQNPSRGRIIDARGDYFIDGVPLHRTPFANDPDHPARSAQAKTLIEDPNAVCRTDDEEIPEHQITIAAAAAPDDVARWARRVTADATILPAGSGDFFSALLGALGLRPGREFIRELNPGRALFLCGSASAYSRELAQTAAARGVAIRPMPDDIFTGAASVDTWARELLDTLSHSARVLITIPQPLHRAASQRLQSTLAELAANILAAGPVENLLLEGGATASAVCRLMGWNAFDVTGEFSPGVVRLQAGDANLIIKPGSYPWPAGIW